MNRILVTDKFVEQLGEEQQVSEELRKDLHSAARLLADDAIANSSSVPFEQYSDVRAISVGDYLVLFQLDPEKSEVYLLSLLRKSESSVPADDAPPRQAGAY